MDDIQRAIDEILGGAVAATVTTHRLETVLTRLAQRVRQQTQDAVLTSLLTADDVAERLGVTPRRVRAIAKARPGTGWQVPGTSQWLFTPDEIEQLQPNVKYRRK